MLNHFKNWIFDLDGTVINSSEEVLNCFKQAFEEADYKINLNRLTSDVIGPPLKQIIKTIAPELVNEEKISEIMQKFRQIYDYDENDVSVIYDGIYDFLCYLKRQKCRLFIATFKPTIPTKRLVKMFHLEDLFNDIYTIDRFGKKITKEEMISSIISTYDLEKKQTVMVGDAASDMIAARNSDIMGIGALWGYGNDKKPLIEKADYVVKDVKELVECQKSNYQTI